jgi:TPR repeat protein
VRLVALDFGAIPPSAAGQPYLCRRCLAPLDPKSEQALVSCVYCQSDNVLGIDLRRDAKVAREETKSLSSALQRRASERRRWRGVSLVGLVLVVAAAWSLRNGIGHNALTYPLEQQCKQNDLAACVALADLISVKESEVVFVNLRKAAALYERGCDANIAHACVRLAQAYWDPDWKGYDKKKRDQLRGRACDLGDAQSCANLGRRR